jgi:hypothetical protein
MYVQYIHIYIAYSRNVMKNYLVRIKKRLHEYILTENVHTAICVYMYV